MHAYYCQNLPVPRPLDSPRSGPNHSHRCCCTHQQEVEDWIRAIRAAKLRQARQKTQESDGHLTALQKRIQNHRMGRKLAYSFTFNGFVPKPNGRVVREHVAARCTRRSSNSLQITRAELRYLRVGIQQHV